MIFVECKADQALVLAVTGVPRRQVVHELQGKPAVVYRLSTGENLFGMVDEDPLDTQPRYLSRMRVVENSAEAALKVLQDPGRNNQLAVLCPRLEEWVLRAARLAGLNVERYGLPTDPSGLHGVINYRLDNLNRLVTDLRESASMSALRRTLAP